MQRTLFIHDPEDLAAIHAKLDFIIAELAKVQMSPQGEWVTVAEYAKIANVTPRTVRNWIDQGRLDTHQHGSKTMVRIKRP